MNLRLYLKFMPLEDVLSVFLGNNRVVPMIYGNEKV